MGWAYYVLKDGREAGYSVRATCDQDGCSEQIDRGLSYLCGDMPDTDDQPGCGNYFCGAHERRHGCPNPDGWWGDDPDEEDEPEPPRSTWRKAKVVFDPPAAGEAL